MKLYHFVLAFVIISFVTILTTDIKTDNLKAVLNKKEQIQRNTDAAIDDGIANLAVVDTNNNIIINKDAAVKSFFLSLHTSFGVQNSKDMQDKLNAYVPVVTITMEDGYYIFYSDEFNDVDGSTYISKRWSEKQPYYYEDDDFIYGFTLSDVVTLYDKNNSLSSDIKVHQLDYHDLQTKSEYEAFRVINTDSIMLNNEIFELVRKNTIITCIENTMAYYTSHHNRIAAQYGITYNFSLPTINKEEWMPYLNDISMFVVFQGYPYGNESGEVFNQIATAGVKVSKNHTFYLEQKGWYLIYHRSDCSELNKEGIIFKDEPYYTIESCAAKGAYACPICNKNTGVYAP